MARPRDDARVQVRDITSPQPLRPTPIQSDTFTGAPRFSGVGDNFFRLADSLRGFSASLGNLADAQMRTDRKNKPREDASLQNLFSRLTAGEKSKVARTGQLPDGTMVAENAAIMKASGMADFATFKPALDNFFGNDYDWTTSDAEADLTRLQNDYIDQAGITDPFALRGFYEGMARYRAKVFDQQHKMRSDKRAEIEGDVTFTLMQDKLYSLIEEGIGPQDAQRHLRAMYKDLGKDGTLGMNYEQLDAYSLALAANIAEQHPDHALAIINMPREGAGPASAPLSSKVKNKAAVQSITATAMRAKERIEANLKERDLYMGNYHRVLDDGDYSPFEDVTIPEGDDSPRTITVKDQQKKFVELLLATSDAAVKQSKFSREVVDKEAMKVLRGLSLQHPFLLEAVNGIEGRIDPDLLAVPAELAKVEETINRYRSMKAAAPSYVNSHLSEDTKTYLDTVDLMIRYKKLDLPRAILVAHKAVHDENARSLSLTFNAENITKSIQDHMDRAGFWNNTTNDVAFNFGRAEAVVGNLASKLYATGEFTEEESIDLAAQTIAKETPVYNGKAVFGLEKMPLTQNWTEGLDSLMEKLKATVAPVFEDEELSINHIGGGRLFISTLDGTPVYNKKGQPIATSVIEINQEAMRLTSDAAQETIDETVEQNRRQQKRRPTKAPEKPKKREGNLLIDLINPSRMQERFFPNR